MQSGSTERGEARVSLAFFVHCTLLRARGAATQPRNAVEAHESRPLAAVGFFPICVLRAPLRMVASSGGRKGTYRIEIYDPL